MLLDKKIKLFLNEFSRQIQKSNSLVLDLMSNVSLINDAIVKQ